MSDPTVRGIVHLVEETKTYGQNNFRKRLIVLEQDKGRFTNYVPIDFVHENCEAADDLAEGDDVEVTYRLSGRKWQRDSNSEVKFFLNAEAISFQTLRKKGDAAGGNAEGPPREFDESEAPRDEPDDVPF